MPYSGDEGAQLMLFEERTAAPEQASHGSLLDELRQFTWEGKATVVEPVTITVDGTASEIPYVLNEFWTSRQRAASNLHEVSYRACFKPQLPRFFIERLTSPGDRVLDPFSGRGTTALEAALLGRRAAASDVNPLSRMLLEPRLAPPSPEDVEQRLREIPWTHDVEAREDLLVFYHRDTLREITALREYLLERSAAGELDAIDRWIRMVAVNRLTGHSRGFFSVYTLPPNQAVSIASQAKINIRRDQVPPRRDVPTIILKKSLSLLADVDGEVRRRLDASEPQLVVGPAAVLSGIPDESIDLVVTSPPFLDVVDYAGDNWLRCWFCGIDPADVRITIAKRPEQWQAAMKDVFVALFRVLQPGKFVAFEVGEVRGGKVRLEELVIPAAASAGFDARLVLVNAQLFTKTANCWGVANNSKGTNTNRIVVLQKPG
jgi:hypothetical protein